MIVDLFRSGAELEAEVLVLRQQIIVLRRGKPSRLSFLTLDRIVLGWACRLVPSAHAALAIVQPDTVKQASDCFGAGSRGAVWAVPQCQLRSGN